MPTYGLSVLLALFSAPASLLVIAALAVYHALPRSGMMRTPG